MTKIKDLRVAAICDKNIKIATQNARRFHINKCYTDIMDMINTEKLDIVDICVPPHMHASLSMQAMDAGCHVIVEKPMALFEHDADAMIKTAQKRGVRLLPVHNALFSCPFLETQSMIDKGELGCITAVDYFLQMGRGHPLLTNRNHWCHKLPGGILSEVLPHPIYIELGILGQCKLASLHVKKSSVDEWIGCSELRAVLEGENGVGTISASLNSSRTAYVVMIHGTKTSLLIDMLPMILVKLKRTKYSKFSVGMTTVSQSLQGLTGAFWAATKFLSGRFYGGHDILIPNFIDAIRSKVQPFVTMEKGRDVVQILEAITSKIGVVHTTECVPA
jgi:predicted dehydrogenase